MGGKQYENKSFVLTGVNQVAIEDRPKPKLEDPPRCPRTGSADRNMRQRYTRRRPPSSFTLPQVHFWKAGRIGRYVVKGPLVLGHECSGACAYVQMGVFVAKPGATVVQAGMGRENVNFPITQVCTQGLTVKGSIRYLPGSYAAAIEPISSGRVDVERLITNSFRFEEAEAAFGLFKQGKPEVFKVMISVVQD